MTEIYTDGACLLNTRGDLAIGLCGFYDQTQDIFGIDKALSISSNAYEMELKAVYLALNHITTNAIIFCDSMQVIDTLKLKNKKLNHHLEFSTRMLFDVKKESYDIDIQWVKSHSQSTGNNIIDQKLEQEMINLINKMNSNIRDIITQRAMERYKFKGCFENFSQDFFDKLFYINPKHL